MMKKSLLALSVAAAAMGAQAADVQVYGLLDTSLSFVSSDADIAGHDRVNSFSMENAKEFGSRFGLKGSEDLGNGYKVAFVLESGIKSDDGSLDQGGKLFGREAHVDLVGPFGKLSAGLMPVFGSTLGADGLFRAIDPLFANYTKAFGSGHVTASSWTRVDNALSYVTPTVAGFTGYAMYSFKNDSSKGGVEGHGGESDRYASLAARYKAGALEAVLVADTTMYGTYRTDTAASKDDGWTVTFGGNYTFDGGVKVLAFTQFFGDQELKARPRAGVGFDGINAVAGDYGFVDGYGVSPGARRCCQGQHRLPRHGKQDRRRLQARDRGPRLRLCHLEAHRRLRHDRLVSGEGRERHDRSQAQRLRVHDRHRPPLLMRARVPLPGERGFSQKGSFFAFPLYIQRGSGAGPFFVHLLRPLSSSALWGLSSGLPSGRAFQMVFPWKPQVNADGGFRGCRLKYAP